MAASFFFYDLETTGISSSDDRIMQFAGQRTDLSLKPLGGPYDIKIKLAPDILPSAEAILLTGILPSENNREGISEAEFSGIFNSEIAVPETIFVGFNNLRFDDEFIRYINYRNFYDPYMWHWADGSSRWDLLDLVRMTRALRPDGIEWPEVDGKPSNKLEQLTKANRLTHSSAHDALSDVMATIEVAKLIKAKQPKLFSFLLNRRTKDKAIDILSSGKPFIYTSSHYPSSYLHTSVAVTLSLDTSRSTATVYDLRYDPNNFINLEVEELADLWTYDKDRLPSERLPIKTVKINRCPALAPMSVLDAESITRLVLDKKVIDRNFEFLNEYKTVLNVKLAEVVKLLDKKQDDRQKARKTHFKSVDTQLYDKFIPKSDQAKFSKARLLALKSYLDAPDFEDERLDELFKLYRARNYPTLIDANETDWWKQQVQNKLFTSVGEQPSNYQQYREKLALLKTELKDNAKRTKILEELEAYAQSIEDDYGTR